MVAEASMKSDPQFVRARDFQDAVRVSLGFVALAVLWFLPYLILIAGAIFCGLLLLL
jgi:hypothetical protein